MRRTGSVVVSLLLVAVIGIPGARASAAPPCTTQGARMLFQYSMLGFDPVNAGTPIADLVLRCQYRLYLDGETVTFRENDVFLGGIAYWYTEAELAELGWTWRQAIADMESIDQRVWLARVRADGSIGRLVEQPLRSTAYRHYTHSEMGRLVSDPSRVRNPVAGGRLRERVSAASPGVGIHGHGASPHRAQDEVSPSAADVARYPVSGSRTNQKTVRQSHLTLLDRFASGCASRMTGGLSDRVSEPCRADSNGDVVGR